MTLPYCPSAGIIRSTPTLSIGVAQGGGVRGRLRRRNVATAAGVGVSSEVQNGTDRNRFRAMMIPSYGLSAIVFGSSSNAEHSVVPISNEPWRLTLYSDLLLIVECLPRDMCIELARNRFDETPSRPERHHLRTRPGIPPRSRPRLPCLPRPARRPRHRRPPGSPRPLR